MTPSVKVYLFAAPDYSIESWTSVKFTLGLDFPNVSYVSMWFSGSDIVDVFIEQWHKACIVHTYSFQLPYLIDGDLKMTQSKAVSLNISLPNVYSIKLGIQFSCTITCRSCVTLPGRITSVSEFQLYPDGCDFSTCLYIGGNTELERVAVEMVEGTVRSQSWLSFILTDFLSVPQVEDLRAVLAECVIARNCE